jgi:octaprenyl-diphosphate synthase
LTALDTVNNQYKPTPTLNTLLDKTAEDMGRINELILAEAHSSVDMIPKLAKHLIDSGGKRIRPMLTCATSRLCGYEGLDHIPLATSVEFLHTATLLHDDVVDESDMRRGKKAARILWGNQASVLVGDYLLGQSFKIMVGVGSLEALKILSNASAIIAEGEVMQLAATNNPTISEDDYMAVIGSKTAALFVAAAELGAVVSNRPDQERQALKDFGENLGIVFQLVDDALDYHGEASQLGKDVGDDFRDGKITLPVILAYGQGTDEEKQFWQRTLGEGKIEDEDLSHAIALIEKYGTIEETIQRARIFGKKAEGALSIFPNNEWSEALQDVIEFCINRAS